MASRLYNRAEFTGRSQQLRSIVSILRDPASPYRCLVIEGAASIGKTWFLRKVEEELAATRTVAPAPGKPAVRVCFLESSDLVNNAGAVPFEESPCAYGLLSKLWTVLHDRFDANVPQTPQPLSAEPLQTQLSMITTLLQTTDGSNRDEQLVVILDGLDEIEPRQLSAFERQMAVVLFDSPHVRILCSRRVKSTQHRFRELKIRRAEKWLLLEPYDTAEEQVNKLLAAQGSSATFATLRPLLRHYSWANPGVNALLTDAYLQTGTVGDTVLIGCLDSLLEAALRGKASDQTRQRLGDVVRALAPAPGKPVARHEIEQSLGPVPLSERADFLAELQLRGVAILDGPQVHLQAEIVELCRELDARGVRYGL